MAEKRHQFPTEEALIKLLATCKKAVEEVYGPVMDAGIDEQGRAAFRINSIPWTMIQILTTQLCPKAATETFYRQEGEISHKMIEPKEPWEQ